MNNETDLRVSRSVELLHRLERTAQEFSQKEAQLVTDWRNHRYKANRKHSVTAQDVTEKLEKQIQALDARMHEEADRLKARYRKFHEAVERAQTQSIRSLPRRIEQARGRWLGKLQMQRIRLEREVGSAKQAAKDTLSETSSALGEQQKQLKGLFKKATTAFKGYPIFAKMLQAETATIPAAKPTPEHVAEKLRESTTRLEAFQEHFLPKIFSTVPLFISMLGALIVGVGLAYSKGLDHGGMIVGGGVSAALIAGLAILYGKGANIGRTDAEQLARALSSAQATQQQAVASAEAHHQETRDALQAQFETNSVKL